MYVRHRIKLRNYNLPCVIESTTNGDTRFYPIELLEIVDFPWTKERFETKTKYKKARIFINQDNSLTISF